VAVAAVAGQSITRTYLFRKVGRVTGYLAMSTFTRLLERTPSKRPPMVIIE
jgi:hypothetical protein